MAKVSVIVVAAGEGKRFGEAKQEVELGGKSILEWSLSRFQEHPGIMDIILVLRNESLQTRLCDKFGKIIATTPGGRERQDSVLAGVKCLDCLDKDIVLVHDGVRPLVSPDLISRVIAAAQDKGAAVPVIPLEDTIKQVQDDKIVQTLDRSDLVRVQTPQGFHYIVLKKALEKAEQDSYQGTDEASLAERLGYTVTAISGEVNNIKITTPGDLKIAEALLEG